MEDNELKEKILCVIKNNIEKFKSPGISPLSDYGKLQFEGESLKIQMWELPVYKPTTIKETIKVRKYWWHKEEVKTIERTEYSLDYYYWKVSLNYRHIFDTTKEEYEEIIKLREEKIRERRMEELNKLCNNEQ